MSERKSKVKHKIKKAPQPIKICKVEEPREVKKVIHTKVTSEPSAIIKDKNKYVN